MISTAAISKKDFFRLLVRGINNSSADIYSLLSKCYIKDNTTPHNDTVKKYINDFLDVISQDKIIDPIKEKLNQEAHKERVKNILIKKLSGIVDYARQYQDNAEEVQKKTNSILSQLKISPKQGLVSRIYSTISSKVMESKAASKLKTASNKLKKLTAYGLFLITLFSPISGVNMSSTYSADLDAKKAQASKTTSLEQLTSDHIASYKQEGYAHKELKEDYFIIEFPNKSTLRYMKYNPETDRCEVAKEIPIAYGAKETPSPITEGVKNPVKIASWNVLNNPELFNAVKVEARITGKGNFNFIYRTGEKKGQPKPWTDKIPWYKMKSFYTTVWVEKEDGTKQRVSKHWIIHSSETKVMFWHPNNRAQSFGCFRTYPDHVYDLYKSIDLPETGLPLIIRYNRFDCSLNQFTAYKDVYDLETEEESLEKAIALIEQHTVLKGELNHEEIRRIIKRGDGIPVSVDMLYKNMFMPNNITMDKNSQNIYQNDSRG